MNKTLAYIKFIMILTKEIIIFKNQIFFVIFIDCIKQDISYLILILF